MLRVGGFGDHTRLTFQETHSRNINGLSKERIKFLSPGRLGTELRSGKHIVNIFLSILSLGDITKSRALNVIYVLMTAKFISPPRKCLPTLGL